MLKLFAVLASAMVVLTNYTPCPAQTPKVEMPAITAPSLLQVVGDNDTSLGPTRYPEFYDYSSDNPTCGNYLKKSSAEGGLSLAPLWTPSQYGNKSTALARDPGYTLIAGLQKNNFKVPGRHKGTSKLLFTWTVRVEGYKLNAYPVWPKLCHPWHGTSSQRFPGGQVLTQLYINGKPFGNPAALTIPDAGASTIFQPSDPTLTGSCLVSRTDFLNGAFPDNMNIEIRWYNDTSMKIVSPKDMRNLIITFVPITTQQQ